MNPAAPKQPWRVRSLGAAVPEEFEAWRPPMVAPAPRRTARRRRPDPVRSGPIWGRIADAEIEDVARQAAERRAARFAARQGFLGRVRVSAPRKPRSLDAWVEVSKPVKLLAAALITTSAAAVVLFALPWLKVQRVEVVGASVISKQLLLAEAGGRWGESTFLLDAPAMTRSLLAQPWVEKASVQVRWPGTLVFSVTPLPAVLVYQQGSSQRVLAASGAVLGPVPTIPPGTLPLLVDQRAIKAAAAGAVALPGRLTQALVALQRVFPATYGVGVTRYLVTSIGALEIVASAGWTADLGLVLTSSQISSIGPKLEALRTLAGQVNLKTGGVKNIYLEDPSQVAVTY